MFYRWLTVSTNTALNGKILYLPIDLVEYLLTTKQKIKVDTTEGTVKNAKVNVESVGGNFADSFTLELI